MSGKIGILTTTKNNKQNKNLYFKAIDVLETTYSSVKLSYLTNLDKESNRNNFKNNDIMTIPGFVPEVNDDSLTLSGQEGVDWVQEANRYLIKNTCKEITISGSSNKNIEAEEGENDLTINLNGINAPTTQITTNRTTTVFIKENSTNNLKSIILNGNFENKRTITLSGDNDVDCTLNVSSIIVNRFSNIEINNGIINASNIIGAEDLGYIGKVILNGGIVNTDQFGGSNDGRTENGITINNGILYTNILGCSGGDGDTGDIKILGGVVRFNYWESYRLSEISNSAVITTPTQSIFDTLKSKNKGLIIQSQQFTSIDSLKIFDINNDAGKITIKKSLTIQHGSNMTINKNCKVIANNLYLQDANGNIETYAPEPVPYTNSILINNGELTISPGTKLYINCFDKYYLDHENNGIIYNFGEIDGKEYLKGTGRIIELDLTAEVNGELYNDITVDKVNRTITINNLTPETDYNINLIASFEPYVERSKIVTIKTNEKPNSLINGLEFNKELKDLIERKIYLGPYNEDYPSLLFDIKPDTYTDEYVNKNFDFIIDISENKDKSIMMYAKEFGCKVIEIRSKNKILFNENSSNMFNNIKLRCNWESGKGSFGLTFNNIDTSNVKNMEKMFDGLILNPNKEDGDIINLNLNKIDTSSATNIRRMLSNVDVKNITNFVIRNVPSLFDDVFYGTGPKDESQKISIGWINNDTKMIANNIYNAMPSYNQVYFEIPNSPSK